MASNRLSSLSASYGGWKWKIEEKKEGRNWGFNFPEFHITTAKRRLYQYGMLSKNPTPFSRFNLFTIIIININYSIPDFQPQKNDPSEMYSKLRTSLKSGGSSYSKEKSENQNKIKQSKWVGLGNDRKKTSNCHRDSCVCTKQGKINLCNMAILCDFEKPLPDSV